MADTLHVLSADSPDWNTWLKPAPHDFYHLAEYHAFAQNNGEGQAEMTVYGTPQRFLAWPYLISDIEGPYADANSVYGYSGPTGLGLDDQAFRAQAWREFRSVWRARKLVTLFTRFHPLLENDRYCAGFHGEIPTPDGEIKHLGRSISISLADDRETRRAQYRQVLRQEIKRAEASGLTIELDTGWRSYERFIDLYSATMGRNDAAQRYQFSKQYFDGLRDALNGNIHLAVALIDGEVAGTMLFTVYHGIAEAHFAGTDQAYARLSPLKGLIDGVADIAAALGADHLHIGAGRGGVEDSLYDFKSRFSRIRHNFQLGRWILDREAYAELSKKAPTAETNGYFPVYRAAEAVAVPVN